MIFRGRPPLRSLANLAFGIAAVGVCVFATPARAAEEPLRPEYDFASLQKLVRSIPEKDRTIANIVPKLPRELRENFTLVYESRSPVASSITPDFPRVILFTPSSRFVATFTGDPAKPGHDRIETIQFDAKNSKFLFREVLLSKHAKPTARCQSCHGEDPRPLIDSYPVWPGFYGSILDTFVPGSPELGKYRKFLATTAKTGVYRALEWTAKAPLVATSVPPFMDPRRYDPKKINGGIDDFPFLPNTRLGMGLTELNRRRIQRMLKASPRYSRKRDAWIAMLLACPGSEFPPTFERRDDILARLNAEDQDKKERENGPGYPPMSELEFWPTLLEVERVIAESGVSPEDFTMAYRKNSLAYFDGILSGIHEGKSYYAKEDFLIELLRDWARAHPSLGQEIFRTYTPYVEHGMPFLNRLVYAQALKFCELPAFRPAARTLAEDKKAKATK